MQDQKFIKFFRTAKIIQLCLLLGMETAFFLILTVHTELGRQLYSNQALFTLCAITWALMIFNLLCLLFDFYKLRSFASESHALTKAAYLDNLTGIPNRHSLDTVFRAYDTAESLAGLGCSMYAISNIKQINDTLGHQIGDQTIRDFCTMFEEIGDTFGFVGRNGGNQFIALFDQCDRTTMQRFSEILDKRVSLYNSAHPDSPIRLSHAEVLCAEEPIQTFTQLLAVTHERLVKEGI